MNETEFQVIDKLWQCANQLGSQLEHYLDEDHKQAPEDNNRALLDTTDVVLHLARNMLLAYKTNRPPASGTNLVTLPLNRAVAESWLRCLKYYELDNLSPEDEKQMLESLEQALKV